MSPIDQSVLLRKLTLIEERLELLRPFATLSLAEYQADIVRKKGAEKLYQELLNAVIDANFHILVQSGRAAPADAFASFVDLAGLGVLTDDLARTLAPSAGLRNRLVHEYERLDDTKVLDAMREAQQQFPQYVASLRARLLT